MTNIILITGGAGYIGSQTARELKKAGYLPIIYDNLSTGHIEAIKGLPLVLGDLGDTDLLNKTFTKYKPNAVMHFAASIQVEESINNPEKYFKNNVVNGLNLLSVMQKNKLDKLIFSSSAAVYGDAKKIPVSETAPKSPINPYGLTKLMFEKILNSYFVAYKLKSISLRYFNASGSEIDGEYGQDIDRPTHLITRVLLTALGKYPQVEIFGNDYPTKDGTCVRDYIHIKDLAAGHILALKALENGKSSRAYNLGTNCGYSVSEVIEAAKKITGIDFKVKMSSRRSGDSAEIIASNLLAKKELGFNPKYSDLKTILTSSWKWHKSHPNGYK